jgi:hypothetical protein
MSFDFHFEAENSSKKELKNGLQMMTGIDQEFLRRSAGEPTAGGRPRDSHRRGKNIHCIHGS